MRTLSRQDLQDVLYGAVILGTGGGGELEEGFGFINHALSQGKTFNMVELQEASDDGLVCTPYLLGAISPLSKEEERQYHRLPRCEEPAVLLAYRRFQEYLGQEFYGTISCEMGGSNTAVSFYAAAMNDHVIIDADLAGRAVPEITHSTYYINGLPVAPMVAANEFGETVILENIVDDLRAETLVRALSKVSRNDIAAIDHALPVRDVKNAVIPGAISLAMNMGRVWREARDAGDDVAQVIADTGEGFVAFRGIVKDCDWETKEGFTLGNVCIDGIEGFIGQGYKIYLKNENMVGWLDDEVHTTIPDMICLLDTATGEPITNPNYKQGQNVAVIILPAPEAFTTEKGLQAFGPSYVGLEQPYEPAVQKWCRS